ncbi:ribosomal protein S7 domain-containing protein [Mycena sp. CBHHK59/15]|nr:ribosomal protein S7 domain-containing protein [Mycena sp. CBHHK59/15]
MAVRRCLCRSMSSLSDQLVAKQAFRSLGSSEIFTAPPPPPKDFMYLPPVGTYSRGPRYEPLMNVPPPEDPLLHFLASMIMRHGHRAKAHRIVSNVLLYLHTYTRAPPLPILREAIRLASPAIRSISQTFGPKVLQIPVALSEKQRTRQGIAWLLEASKDRPGSKLEERLAREMIDVLQRIAAGRGEKLDSDKTQFSGTLGKKEAAHKFGMVNRGNVRIPRAARNAAGL